jgi:hypothetical protein
LEKEIRDLSEIVHRKIISAHTILDYPFASDVVDQVFSEEPVGFTVALCFVINLATKSISAILKEGKACLPSEEIESLRSRFFRLTSTIESLRRSRVKIHVTLDQMNQKNNPPP